jgi:hypothetical protein
MDAKAVSFQHSGLCIYITALIAGYQHGHLYLWVIQEKERIKNFTSIPVQYSMFKLT